ncbi:DUF2336 domain-containing protein [Denitrobaculum tricleocarpae]|uniref:DUF2336 domain-containing protein n=1 Tax=Denitrobaculum tricleocarpae TaxID=2591009 RepID=A0A545U1F4_9PROT|nr:DUF2336 domain-containing protein [Denitrobaculum tricleocarpae]
MGKAAAVSDQTQISYEESKELAKDSNISVRLDLARRSDVRPEILYFLAEDPSAEVRRQIASNSLTPIQADLILARDSDETVRIDLASKISALRPELDSDQREKAGRYIADVLDILAQDQTTRVRQVLADTLKDATYAPVAVIRRLAADVEDVVANPILQFSPILSDEDLLEIIDGGCASGRLCAISQRQGLGEAVADAIVSTDDRGAVTALLENKSAQIREEMLDKLVEQAPQVEVWHKPLVERPQLSPKATRRLATFVAKALLKTLERRAGLDEETAQMLEAEMTRRLKEEEGGDDDSLKRAQELHAAGKLDDETLSEALISGDRGLVRCGLAVRSKLSMDQVSEILASRSAKGVTALAWKADCSMRFAMQIQQQLGGIPPKQLVHALDNGGYPMGDEELQFQLELFQKS